MAGAASARPPDSPGLGAQPTFNLEKRLETLAQGLCSRGRSGDSHRELAQVPRFLEAMRTRIAEDERVPHRALHVTASFRFLIGHVDERVVLIVRLGGRGCGLEDDTEGRHFIGE